jgi:hypothetical protein
VGTRAAVGRVDGEAAEFGGVGGEQISQKADALTASL